MSARKGLVVDLYCCAGGASEGYHRGGYIVRGMDIKYQPDYAFYFEEADVLEAAADFLQKHSPDFVHASPPCQANNPLTKGNRQRPGWTDSHVDLIPQTREILEAYGAPYVIENTNGVESMRRDWTACGEMFGLAVIRHRHFEFGGGAVNPMIAHKPHRGRTRGWRHGQFYDGPYVAVYGRGGGKGTVQEWQDALDFHATDDRVCLAEAIPPAYTQAIAEAQ